MKLIVNKVEKECLLMDQSFNDNDKICDTPLSLLFACIIMHLKIFRKLCLTFYLTDLSKQDTKVITIRIQVCQKCSEQIRAVDQCKQVQQIPFVHSDTTKKAGVNKFSGGDFTIYKRFH